MALEYPDKISGFGTPAQPVPGQPRPTPYTPPPAATFAPYPVPARKKNPFTKWVVGGVLTFAACCVVSILVLAGVAATRIGDAFDHMPGMRHSDLTETVHFSMTDDSPACSIAASEDNEVWAVGLMGLGTNSGVLVHSSNYITRVGDWSQEDDAFSSIFPPANGERRRVPNAVVREGAVGVRFLPGSKRLVFLSREMQRLIIATRDDDETHGVGFRRLTRLEMMNEKPLVLELSPDGKVAAIGCGNPHDYTDDNVTYSAPDEAVVVLWDLDSPKRLATLSGHKAAVRCVAFLDKKRLISGGNDLTLRVWDLENQKLSRTIDVEAPVISLSASPGGKQVVYCTERGHIVVLDLETRERHELHKDVTDAPTQNSRVTTRRRAVFSPDGLWIALGRGRSIELVDVADFKIKHTQDQYIDDTIYDLAWSPDSSRIGAAYGRGAKVWRLP